MSTSLDQFSRPSTTPFHSALRLLLAVTLLAPLMVHAQSLLMEAETDGDLKVAHTGSLPDSLPDSPGALVARSSSSSSLPNLFDWDPQAQKSGTDPVSTSPATKPKKLAGHLALTVRPHEVALPMTAHDKFVAGLRDSYSLFAMAGWFSAAGWGQLINGPPNYGTDSGAFGQRLGAAALRGSTQGIMTKSIFAPLYRQDPRYFTMGRGNPFLKRAFYAATRVLVARTDSGKTTVNFALLSGNAIGAAMTPLYFPSHNRSAPQVAKTFGTSLAGSAFGFLVDEFFIDALVDIHLRKQQP